VNPGTLSNRILRALLLKSGLDYNQSQQGVQYLAFRLGRFRNAEFRFVLKPNRTKINLYQWKRINNNMVPAIPAAKNLVVFSLFVCRRALVMLALALTSVDEAIAGVIVHEKE
jgi:hypothetical protein